MVFTSYTWALLYSLVGIRAYSTAAGDGNRTSRRDRLVCLETLRRHDRRSRSVGAPSPGRFLRGTKSPRPASPVYRHWSVRSALLFSLIRRFSVLTFETAQSLRPTDTPWGSVATAGFLLGVWSPGLTLVSKYTPARPPSGRAYAAPAPVTKALSIRRTHFIAPSHPRPLFRKLCISAFVSLVVSRGPTLYV